MSLKDQLDRIEHKLDLALERSLTNENDIRWIKGLVKVGVPVVLSIIGYITIQFINTL